MNMPTAGVRGGDVAAARTELPKIVVRVDGKRMGLVSEAAVRKLQSMSLGPPLRADLYNPELMRKMGLNEELIDKLLRLFHARQYFRTIHEDVLQQYNARGYAYLEIQGDCPRDNEDMDEQIRLLTMELGYLAT